MAGFMVNNDVLHVETIKCTPRFAQIIFPLTTLCKIIYIVVKRILYDHQRNDIFLLYMLKIQNLWKDQVKWCEWPWGLKYVHNTNTVFPLGWEIENQCDIAYEY